MRVVLDECVNPRLERLLETAHAVFTVPELGWGGLPDNILVEHLQGRCEVFLTIDHGFEHQHNLSLLGFGIVIVHVPRNRLAYYQAIRQEIYQAVSSVRPGEVIRVGFDR
ncbi:MAG: DUF5615 family PIN-like protein [Terriglobia bacterium]|jgi:hypothetical protein